MMCTADIGYSMFACIIMSYKNKSWNERSRRLITLVFGLLLGFVLIFGESRWETSPLIEESLMLLGCIGASIGAFGRIWCSLYIAGYKNARLVMDGPYGMCRNPLYFFSFIGGVGGVGVACATETMTIPLIVLVAFAVYYPLIIKREQKRLTELFGEEYSRYCDEVPAFFPRWRRVSQPETYTVNPKVFTHNFIDALWFIWLIGIFEFVSGLHDSGVLPVWFRLP